jgi:hypothetical protein
LPLLGIFIPCAFRAVPCPAELCCAVLCCAVLCCAVLCCAVLCCAVLCCAVLCCAVHGRMCPCACVAAACGPPPRTASGGMSVWQLVLRDSMLADAVMSVRLRPGDRADVFKDATGLLWLRLLWTCTGIVDALTVALQVGVGVWVLVCPWPRPCMTVALCAAFGCAGCTGCTCCSVTACVRLCAAVRVPVCVTM